jgi:hypothetical protein
MGWLKSVGKAILWVVRNETVRSAAIVVAKTVIEEKRKKKQ